MIALAEVLPPASPHYTQTSIHGFLSYPPVHLSPEIDTFFVALVQEKKTAGFYDSCVCQSSVYRLHQFCPAFALRIDVLGYHPAGSGNSFDRKKAEQPVHCDM